MCGRWCDQTKEIERDRERVTQTPKQTEQSTQGKRKHRNKEIHLQNRKTRKHYPHNETYSYCTIDACTPNNGEEGGTACEVFSLSKRSFLSGKPTHSVLGEGKGCPSSARAEGGAFKKENEYEVALPLPSVKKPVECGQTNSELREPFRLEQSSSRKEPFEKGGQLDWNWWEPTQPAKMILFSKDHDEGQ